MFNLEKPFHKSLPFNITLYTTIALTVISIVFIICSSNLSPRTDYLGFNKAIEVFKVPLGLMWTGLIIIGVLLTIYRSEQAREQIYQTERNYKSSLFLDHRKLFCDNLKELDLEICSLSPDFFYNFLFPDNSFENPNTKPKKIDDNHLLSFQIMENFIEFPNKINHKNIIKSLFISMELLNKYEIEFNSKNLSRLTYLIIEPDKKKFNLNKLFISDELTENIEQYKEDLLKATLDLNKIIKKIEYLTKTKFVKSTFDNKTIDFTLDFIVNGFSSSLEEIISEKELMELKEEIENYKKELKV